MSRKNSKLLFVRYISETQTKSNSKVYDSFKVDYYLMFIILEKM